MKIIEESNEMCIEATFTNMTSLPIQMRSVNFESQNFEVAALNYELGGDKWIFGGRNRLNTIESRQYLYLLKPIQSIRFNSEALKAVSLLGKLDIIWVTGIGAVGHIHTFPLEKQVGFRFSYKQIFSIDSQLAKLQRHQSAGGSDSGRCGFEINFPNQTSTHQLQPTSYSTSAKSNQL